MGIIIDLSSNNPHPIDYAAAKAGGVIAAIIKATDGTGYTNPFYAEDAAGFEAVGVPVLAYHFAEFGNAAAEAAYFVSVAGDKARVLDSETNQDAAWQNAFLAALNLPANEEMDYGSASTLPRTGIRAFLWPASYGRDYGFGDCWQFTDAQSVPGIGGQVDASTWVGPQADFDSLFNTTSAPPAPLKLPEGFQMQFTHPVSGLLVATDKDGEIFARDGALPHVVGLNQHPEWKAGATESGQGDPCVGIAAERDSADKGGGWGYTFLCEPVSGAGSFGPYNLYHINADGSF